MKRAGSFGALIADSKSFKILIDHHEEPNYDGDIYYNDSTCCSTAQLVFDLIDELDDLELVDLPIAEAIYFGLITPVSVITRIFGRDELNLKNKNKKSYWVKREPLSPAGDSFKNQF